MKYEGAAGSAFIAYSTARERYVRWVATIFDGSSSRGGSQRASSSASSGSTHAGRPSTSIRARLTSAESTPLCIHSPTVPGPPKLVLVLSENWTLTPPRDVRALVQMAV